MTTSNELYFLNTSNPSLSNISGSFPDRSPDGNASDYGLSASNYENDTEPYTLLRGGSYTPGTNKRTGENDWHTISNVGNLHNRSGNGCELYWKVKSYYHNTIKYDAIPKNGNPGDGYFIPNVIGLSFQFNRDNSTWSDFECGIYTLGIIYYNPDTDEKRIAQFANDKSAGSKIMESDSGNLWYWDKSNPRDFVPSSGQKGVGWCPSKIVCGNDDKKKILEENWLYAGFFIKVGCSDGGSASKARSVRIREVQPIGGEHDSNIKTVLPWVKVKSTDLKGPDIKWRQYR